jgi:Amt family ammonium transporter
VVSLILLAGIRATVGLRDEEDQEREGLDISMHGESLG